MAQTERTTAEVNALLADNTSGEISPIDMRDTIASALGGYGSLILTIAGAGATKSAIGQTPLKITEYNAAGPQSSDTNTNGTTVDDAAGTITIGQTGVYYVTFFCSFSLDANNKTVHFQPFINDVVGLVEVDRFLGTGSDVGVVSMGAVVQYTAADVVDIRVFIDSGTAELTFEAMGFSVFRVG